MDTELLVPIPNVEDLVTEDDTPVDNFASEKQQRLLTGVLYSAWRNKTFLAAANVGIYTTIGRPPIVPDVFLSLDVTVPDQWWEKQNRCYLLWQFDKPPDVVIEIVSNREGNELESKLNRYEQMRVSYYVVFDPNHELGSDELRIFELRGRHYLEMTETWLEQVDLGLTVWEGIFEAKQARWLRWCDAQGNLLLTGDEQADLERERTRQERQRAEQEHQRAEQERQRAERLAERLRALGQDPDLEF
ncbi:Uma2 family endonuclease [Thermostichus vulcanus]|uniref:Uma2 family endonuclease n=1 Tax=Thermostichus vulcanus str. 'Rupite' TaxID=2813851 RepID=A0ABT0CFJ0_THEVL|nr:Uma2 family endonuclease [Thermostichus vulcanus]MCJ2544135.1 Uma2 family endonuclease [Thermostichus vulcanus str. 'Rupite']